VTVTKTQLADIAERVAWTFLQSVLAVFVVADIGTARTAFVAAAAAALAVIKGFAATRLGDAGANLP